MPPGFVHVPFGVILLIIDVPMSHIIPCEGPVEAHLTCSAVGCGVRHKQRDQDDAEGGYIEAHKEGLGVKGFAPHSEVYCQLEGGGAAHGHCHRGGSQGGS